jgi:uncharacterized protein (DUF111 family)
MPGDYETDTVTRLETNLDDLSPEITGAVTQMLLEAGALDVWLTPIQMKKGRPGVLLSLLCDEPRAEDLADIVFRETSAFGLRKEQVLRLKLRREFREIETAFGPVTVKLGMKGDEVVQCAPEFESCRALAKSSQRPLHQIYQAAWAACSGQTHGSFELKRNPDSSPR